MKDIYFGNEAHQTRLPTGHINFEKIAFISDMLLELIVLKGKLTRPKVEVAGQVYLRSTVVCNEAELYRLSLLAEVPDKTEETRAAARLRQLEDVAVATRSP